MLSPSTPKAAFPHGFSWVKPAGDGPGPLLHPQGPELPRPLSGCSSCPGTALSPPSLDFPTFPAELCGGNESLPLAEQNFEAQPNFATPRLEAKIISRAGLRLAPSLPPSLPLRRNPGVFSPARTFPPCPAAGPAPSHTMKGPAPAAAAGGAGNAKPHPGRCQGREGDTGTAPRGQRGWRRGGRGARGRFRAIPGERSEGRREGGHRSVPTVVTFY